jgi:hypothetical protein
MLVFIAGSRVDAISLVANKNVGNKNVGNAGVGMGPARSGRGLGADVGRAVTALRVDVATGLGAISSRERTLVFSQKSAFEAEDAPPRRHGGGTEGARREYRYDGICSFNVVRTNVVSQRFGTGVRASFDRDNPMDGRRSAGLAAS